MTQIDTMKFVLDANVYLEAYHRYYGMDLVPGFWKFIEEKTEEGLILSIDRVYEELKRKEDSLSVWADNMSDMFVSSTDTNVVSAFQEMIEFVNASVHFTDAAKFEFADVADGWIAAYAKVHHATVVTHEKYDPNIKKKVKLPNICRQFDVLTMDTFEMLRYLGARFDLSR